jgi:hypothetical protein
LVLPYREVILTFPLRKRDHGPKTASWWDTTAPVTNVAAASPLWIGIDLQLTAPGRIMGFREWIGSGVGTVRWAVLADFTTARQLRATVFRADVTPPVNDWMQTWFRPWCRPAVGHTLRLMVLADTGYHRTNAALVSPVTHGNITFQRGVTSSALDFISGATATSTAANGVDILFKPD